MSRNTTRRCREAQRFGVVLGAAAVLAGSTSGAVAATGVVIPLEPGVVDLSTFPVENFGPMDPMADPNAAPTFTLVDVQYGGSLTVNLPVELDSAAVEVTIGFDDNADGIPDDVTYTNTPTSAPGDPGYIAVTGRGSGTLQITLPDDDSTGTDEAVLFIEPLTPTLSSVFTHLDPLTYDLNFDAAAPALVSVHPWLVAVSQEPCDLSSLTPCATPVTAGSTVTLDLTAGSALRELGIANLSAVEAGLQQLDANGIPVGALVELPVQVTGTGSTATFTVPAGTAAGTYGLVIGKQTADGVAMVFVQLTIAAASVTPAAAPTTAVNAGLRSNTGVEVVETGSTGNATVATGAGLLLLAGAGGIAVARTRRRPAGEGGTCAS